MLVVSQIASQVHDLSVRVLNYLVENLSLLNNEMLHSQAKNIGYSIWNNNPATFTNLLGVEGASKVIAINTIASLSNDELINRLQVSTELILPILELRPDIVKEPRLWLCDAKIRNTAFDVVKNSPDKWSAVIRTLIATGVDNVVKPAFKCFGYSAVWQVLTKTLDDAKEAARRFAKYVS